VSLINIIVTDEYRYTDQWRALSKACADAVVSDISEHML